MGVLAHPWIPIISVILIVAYKNLPWMWHLRFVRTLLTRLFVSPVTTEQLSPECLFLPAIHRTRSPLSECDYNIHKSNSTYFTDLDISRGNLSLLLFSQRLSFRPTLNRAVMILSGVQCVFKREIKPYQPYEVWSRILSWDEKWLYIVSHFVERNEFRPSQFYLQKRNSRISPRSKTLHTDDAVKKVFASSLSRYVFKQGRKTFPPEQMFTKCGLLPPPSGSNDGEPSLVRDKATCHSIEQRRKRDLETAQLRAGWDAVHNAFEGDVPVALGRYTDLLWRNLLLSESKFSVDPQVPRSDRTSASTGTFAEERSVPTISMRDRRIQVRRAQKTYRLKKEAIVEGYKTRVTELEQDIGHISETFDQLYDAAVKSNLVSTHQTLCSYLDQLRGILESTGHQRKRAAPTTQGSGRSDKTISQSARARRIGELRPSMIFGYDVSGELKSDDVNETDEIETQNSASLEDNGSCGLRTVGTKASDEMMVGRPQGGYDIERPFGNYFKYTNCFREPTFSRRLHRYCLEYAFLLFIDPRSSPPTVYRVFRLVPCIRAKEKMYPFFKALVHGNVKDRLEVTGLPFYTIGGAGTHYPLKDNLGNPIYPSQMRLPRRILCVLPTGEDMRGHNDVSSEHLETFGLGGQWFNCTDVEGYLREQGVHFEGSSLFAEVYDTGVRPSDGNNRATQNHKATAEGLSQIVISHNSSTHSPVLQTPTKHVRFDDSQEGISSKSQLSCEDTQKRTPLQQACRTILDIESFFNRKFKGLDNSSVHHQVNLSGLLRGVVILGRAPGFRRTDVEDAFKRSLLRQQPF
ncbi:conserved hypothetical protein [Paecilomyces variotii No. 5]|uniref:Uncharacterized protein n=1 Tax=Byssochlamys spectabilis (strain No. 5 / NBRC 109023) TaxID=1356009 RepID=V5FDM4_BYSSN|nr:conserved hypothetical protein [Paecilomyces variotii No. 5]